MFVPGRFDTLHELTRYLRSLVTLVTPDPNTMLRVARLRDAKWRRPAGVRGADEKPRMMSFTDAVQIASALWVKEAGGVADLKFLMFDDLSSNEAKRGPRLSLLRLQDYADDARANSDVMAAVQLTRVQPLRQTRPVSQSGSIRTRVRARSPEGRSSVWGPIEFGRRTCQPALGAACSAITRTRDRRSYPRVSGGSQGRTTPRVPERPRPC